MKRTVRTLTVVLTAAVLLLSFAACADRAADSENGQSSVNQDGQNPVMNFVGEYSADRCFIIVEADGETDAKISAVWANSADETAEYTMSGRFDPETYRINYSDGEKKIVKYDDTGAVTEETVVYSDGVGRIQFYDNNTLAWQDEQEADSLIGVTFTFDPVEG